MKPIEKYVFDHNIILAKAYDLLCTFFANKEIARRSRPDDPNEPLAFLEERFFGSKVSRLLIEIAASLRVMGDQMRTLSMKDPVRMEYDKAIQEVDGYHFALFDDLNLNFRETCNKIIHSNVFEPHTQEGHEAHETDLGFMHGDDEKTIHWRHVSNYVRLSGNKGSQTWYVLLDIEVFVSAIVKVLS